MPTENQPAAYVLRAPKGSAFREVPLALSGFPREEAGEPCHYLKRELCPIGETRVHPDKGYKIEVTAERAQEWIQNFSLMAERGQPIPAPPAHDDAANSFGKWVNFTREPNARGGSSLFGVLKVVGDRTKEDVLNRDVSIFVTRGTKDDKGNQYGEALTHVAVTPYPALTGLSGWTSIAASRGPAVQVPILSLATPEPEESTMDLSKLREAIGAAKEVTDEQLITSATAKLTEAKSALELSRTQKATIDALTRERDAKSQEVLALSAGDKEPDAHTMVHVGRAMQSARAELVKSGVVSEGGVKEIDAIFLANGKPNRLALSLSANPQNGQQDWLYTRLLDVIARNPGVKTSNEIPRDVAARADAEDAVRLALSGDPASADTKKRDRQAELLAEQLGQKK